MVLSSGVTVMSTVLPPRSTTKCKGWSGTHGDDALHLAKGLNGGAVDADDAVARQKSRSLRRAPRVDDVDLGGGDALAEYAEDRSENDDGEEEVGNRARRHHGRALGERFALEASRALFRRKLIERPATASTCNVLIVDELHIAAEWDPRDLPPRVVAVGKAHDLGPEADRERFDADPAPARDEEMTELVDKHHDGQNEKEGKQVTEQRVAEARELNNRVHEGRYL